MKTNISAMLIAFFIVTSVFSQSKLDNYKYIIVPKKFDFLKEVDQYRLNGLTKFLFNKYGFNAVMEGDEYPADLIANRCSALKSSILEDGTLFKSKLSIVLKDCNDQVIYTSQVGESREKEYAKSYNEALRGAFNSIVDLNYSYNGNSNISSPVITEPKKEVSKEIEQLKEEIQLLKKEKEVVEVVEVQKPAVEVIEPKPVVKINKAPVETIVKETIEKAPLKKAVEVSMEKAPMKETLSDVLYAQVIENGFQLVDSSPKVVYKIKQSSLDNVFFVENKDAIIYKKSANWVLEYYENNVLKQEELAIKF